MSWGRFLSYGKSFCTGFVVGLPIYVTVTDFGFCVARVDGISMQVRTTKWPMLNLEDAGKTSLPFPGAYLVALIEIMAFLVTVILICHVHCILRK